MNTDIEPVAPPDAVMLDPGNPYDVKVSPDTGEVHGNDHPTPSKTARIGGAMLITAGLLAAGQTTHETVTTTHPVAVVETVDTPVAVPQNPTELDISVPGDVLNAYQRDFEVNPSDQKDSDQQVASLIEQALPRDQWSDIKSVSIIGMASAEDERADQGLQSESIPNQHLAEERADLAELAVDDVLGSSVDLSHKVTVKAVEHKWNDDDVATGEALAEQFGYGSVANLVEQYNLHPGSVPPSVEQFLKPLLDANRGAKIRIILPGEDQDKPRVVIVHIPHTVLKMVAEKHQVDKTAAVMMQEQVVNTRPYDTDKTTVPQPNDEPLEPRVHPGGVPAVVVKVPKAPALPEAPVIQRSPRRLPNDPVGRLQQGKRQIAISQKQPLPDNYFGGRQRNDGRRGYKGKHVNRRGRG
ncbi:MAG TPA: hypothetical protein VLF87_01540 [Patescibacteria group bacterium]|nr:hypothetical protein [Patescibacteria group bacterium]